MERIVELLRLSPHPFEGGYFAETYRSDESFDASALPDRYDAPRPLCTAIYYLLTPTTFSAMHRLASDEIFHFYAGDPVEMLRLHPDGTHSVVVIGNDIEAGQSPRVLVPRGVWQGCRLIEGGEYALMGTTVAPGYDHPDYEHGDRAELASRYPRCAEMIGRLTRG